MTVCFDNELNLSLAKNIYGEWKLIAPSQRVWRCVLTFPRRALFGSRIYNRTDQSTHELGNQWYQKQESGPRLLLLENRRKIQPKEIPSRLIPRLLVVFTRQLEILVTTLKRIFFSDSCYLQRCYNHTLALVKWFILPAGSAFKNRLFCSKFCSDTLILIEFYSVSKKIFGPSGRVRSPSIFWAPAPIYFRNYWREPGPNP